MSNFVKISHQIKKFSIPVLDFGGSVCMAVICYSGPISAISTTEQLLGDKITCTKLQIYISKKQTLICIYRHALTEIYLINTVQGIKNMKIPNLCAHSHYHIHTYMYICICTWKYLFSNLCGCAPQAKHWWQPSKPEIILHAFGKLEINTLLNRNYNKKYRPFVFHK